MCLLVSACALVSAGADDCVSAVALEWKPESHERETMFPTGTVLHSSTFHRWVQLSKYSGGFQ